MRPLGALAIANALSLSGNVVATVAIPWLVLESTGSAALAALSVVSAAAAAAIGALVAGRVVDALGPSRASALADVLSGLALVPIPLLAAAGVLELWHLVGLVFVGTVADAAGSTARQSLVPLVAAAAGVGNERANSLFTGTEHVGYLVGAPAAGLLIATFGAAGAIWVDVATFVLSAGVVLVFVASGGERAAAASGSQEPFGHAAREPSLRDAARRIRHDPALLALVVIPSLAVVLIGPLIPILLPVLARELYGDPVVLGVLIAAFGVGGLVGATGFGIVAHRVPRRRLYLGVFVAWPFLYGVLAVGAPLAVTIPALAILGAAAGSLVPMQATIRQERTPAELLPRVVGLSTGPIPVVAPVGVLAAGLLIDALGVAATLAIMVVAISALAVGVARSEGVRRFEEPADPEPAAVAA